MENVYFQPSGQPHTHPINLHPSIRTYMYNRNFTFSFIHPLYTSLRSFVLLFFLWNKKNEYFCFAGYKKIFICTFKHTCAMRKMMSKKNCVSNFDKKSSPPRLRFGIKFFILIFFFFTLYPSNSSRKSSLRQSIVVNELKSIFSYYYVYILRLFPIRRFFILIRSNANEVGE